MPGTATPHQIDWRSLLAYVRALNEFTRAEPSSLGPASFSRLNALPQVVKPPSQVFTTADGCRLAYRSYVAMSSQVLVLVHGSGGFGDQMQALAHGLAASGVATVYTIDMRGHGQSEGRRGHAVRHPGQLAEDLTAFIERVHKLNPHARLCLGGHSAGGGLVLGLARTPADRLIDSYLFLAPFLGLGCNANRPYFGGWVGLRAMTLRALTLANLLGVQRFNDTTVVDFATRYAADPLHVASWSYNTMLAFGPGRWLAEAAPIAPEKPVLVLAGEADECFDPSAYEAAFAVAAPHARIRMLGPIGHWDLLVDDAVPVEIANWLADQALAGLTQLVPPAPPSITPAAKPLREAS